MRVGTNSQPAVDISRSEVGKMKEYKKKEKKKGDFARETSDEFRLSRSQPGCTQAKLQTVQLPMTNFCFSLPNGRNEGRLASKWTNQNGLLNNAINSRTIIHETATMKQPRR